jgi:hypothetical protein
MRNANSARGLPPAALFSRFVVVLAIPESFDFGAEHLRP